MTTTLSPIPVFQWINSQGQPLVGGQLFSYAAGTSTPLATYTDSTGSAANTNPVILDASGSANVWLSSNNYKLVLKDSLGNVLWTVDNINATQGSYLSTLGGKIYSPGQNTAVTINADTGLSAGLVFQVSGINSTLVSTGGAGTLDISSWNGTAWVPILVVNGTITQYLGTSWTFGANGTSAPNVIINGVAGTARTQYFSTAGVTRWGVGASSNAESGSNAGSDFLIQAFNDAGGSLGNAALCTRATQAWSFPVSITSPSVTDTSDVRLKTMGDYIEEEEALGWINNLFPQHFRWKKDKRKDIGLSAQDVREVLPEIVTETNGILGVAYQKLVCPLIVLIRGHANRIRELEDRIRELEERL